MKTTLLLLVSLMVSNGPAFAQSNDTTITPLLTKDAAGVPGKTIEMIAVEYAPGAVDPVHKHHAQAMVYVVEGSVVMQVQGGPELTLHAGQTFYEEPGDVHVVARNASTTARARFVVFFLKAKGTPTLVPVK